jgi:hypothetical protein
VTAESKNRFTRVLISVLAVEVTVLALLALLQSRYN